MTTERSTRLGEYEPRHDLPPLKRKVRNQRTGLVHEVFAPMLDRKVYETWVEDGQKMGRWTWESGL